MSAVMASRTWRALVKAKRRRAEFRITLTVRGKEVVKTYRNEEDYLKWKMTFEANRKREENGIEDIRTEVIYP